MVTKATADTEPGAVRPRYYFRSRQNCDDARWAAPNKFAMWGTDWRTRAPRNSTDHGPAGPVIKGRLPHWQQW